jgi:hypothetical protein
MKPPCRRRPFTVLRRTSSVKKWLKAGGARTIAIPYDAEEPELLDGVLEQIRSTCCFCLGGEADLSPAASHLLRTVHRANSNGDSVRDGSPGFEAGGELWPGFRLAKKDD